MDDELKARLFASVFDDSEDAVLALDSEGVVRTCSRGMSELMGYTRDEAVGKAFSALFADGEECSRVLEAARGVAILKNFEAVMLAKDGGREKMFMTLRALGQPEAVGFLVELAPAVAEIDDAPEHKKVQEALVRMERFSAVGRVAASFAHEMRTPLHVICSTSEYAAEFLSPDGEMRKSLDMILRNARYASDSVQALLDFARVGRFHLKQGSLNGVVQTALGFAEKLCQKQKIEIDTRLGELPELLLDEHHMRAVVHNLLVNAIESMPDGGRLTIRSGLSEGGGRVEFEVRDTGSGMSHEVLSKAGSPFFTTKEHGTGLGLYLTKRVLAEHGASMTLESAPGQGTTVSVRFGPEPKSSEKT